MVEKKEGSLKKFKPFFVTKEIIKELENRLLEVQLILNEKLPEEFRNASHPDWRENSPKDCLDNEWSLRQAEFASIQSRLDRAIPVDGLPFDTRFVGPGVIVTLANGSMNERYTMLSVTDLKRGYLSITSPLGSQLLGRKPGEIVRFSTPDNTKQTITIVSIEGVPEKGEEQSLLPDSEKDIVYSIGNDQVMDNKTAVFPYGANFVQKIREVVSPKVIQTIGSTESPEKKQFLQNTNFIEKPKSNQENHDHKDKKRFRALLSYVQQQKWPLSTHTIREVQDEGGNKVIQETIIFLYNKILVKAVLSTPIIDDSSFPQKNEVSMKMYKFVNKKWENYMSSESSDNYHRLNKSKPNDGK